MELSSDSFYETPENIVFALGKFSQKGLYDWIFLVGCTVFGIEPMAWLIIT
jgi:hypothetical protein